MAIPAVGQGQATRLSGVQALRGLAAAGVIFSHAARHVNKVLGAPGLITLFQAGHCGVDLFFIISGFIILFVHEGDIGRPGRLTHYAVRRFNRVLPLYWVALVLTIAMSFAGAHAWPGFSTLLWSAALLPSFAEPLLGIAWTLQFEAVFYVAFAALILNRRAGTLLLAGWLVLIAGTAFGLGAGRLPQPLCGIYGLEFFIGMGVAALVKHRRVAAPLALAGAGGGCFIAGMIVESAGYLDGFGVLARLVYGCSAACLVLGVSAAERSGRLGVPVWLQTVGGASYSIYLFQFVFIGLVWQIWLKAGFAQSAPTTLLFAALACVALGGGIVMSLLVEQPLLRLMRGRRGIASGTAMRTAI